MLRSRGVEVVQFDFLTPDAVAVYCYDRGFLQCLWECGGTLAAPAIASKVIHKAMAFIAPKLVGSAGLGNILPCIDCPYLPSSCSPQIWNLSLALAAAAAAALYEWHVSASAPQL